MTVQPALFEVDTPPVRVPKRNAGTGKPKWSAHSPVKPVKCDDCMRVLLEAKGEGPAALNARWKRVQDGADLLLCYGHGRARRVEDGIEEAGA